MSDVSHEGAIREAGWRFDVDAGGGELHIEHVDSGKTYVFDDQGNLSVPGDGEVGGDIHELQAALAATLAADCRHGDSSDDEESSCSIECDETTGEVTIESGEKITLDAPSIELSAGTDVDIDGGGTVEIAGSNLDLSGQGAARLTSSGVVTVDGGLIKLN